MEEEREEEIVIRLREILKTADLNTTSAGAVRRQLESELGLDLSSRKKFISQLIDDIIQQQPPHPDDRDDEDDYEHNAVNDVNPDGEDADADADADAEAVTLPRFESTKKRKPTGFTRPCSLSPQLQHFLQVPELPRTEVVKRLWAYIRDNNLQDPNNRRNIKCDPKLHSIFRVQTINMFQMNKVLSKHIWPLHSADTDATGTTLSTLFHSSISYANACKFTTSTTSDAALSFGLLYSFRFYPLVIPLHILRHDL